VDIKCFHSYLRIALKVHHSDAAIAGGSKKLQG